MGYGVTMVAVVTPDESSMASLRAGSDLDPQADLVLLRNMAFGDREDFVVWDGSDKENIALAKGKAILAERHGHDLVFPMLNRGTVALIGALKLSFVKAESISESPLRLGRRSQVGVWLTTIEREFEKAGDVMGLVS